MTSQLKTPNKPSMNVQLSTAQAPGSGQRNDVIRNYQSSGSSNHKNQFLSPKSGRGGNENNSNGSDTQYITPRASTSNPNIFNQNISGQKQTQISNNTMENQKGLRQHTLNTQGNQSSGELLNIKLPKSKKAIGNGKINKQSQKKAQVEIWKGIAKKQNMEPMSNKSFKDSDIADEFEYELDAKYFETQQNRYFSPQNQGKGQSPEIINQKRQTTKSPKSKGQNKNGYFQMSTNSGTDEDYAKPIKNMKASNKQLKQFFKRMEDDNSKRNSKLAERQTKSTYLQKDVGSSQKGKANQELNTEERSPSQEKRKLKPQECMDFYNRVMKQEQRKQQTIKMLQEAKRKDEDLDMEQNIVHNKNLSKDQQLRCYNRLQEDAQRRKHTMLKHQQQQVIFQEEEMKNLFKPKINQSYPVKRETILTNNLDGGSTEAIVSGQLTLEQKIVIFQNDAQKRVEVHHADMNLNVPPVQ